MHQCSPSCLQILFVSIFTGLECSRSASTALWVVKGCCSENDYCSEFLVSYEIFWYPVTLIYLRWWVFLGLLGAPRRIILLITNTCYLWGQMATPRHCNALILGIWLEMSAFHQNWTDLVKRDSLCSEHGFRVATQKWVAKPCDSCIVDQKTCIVTISRCIVASRRHFWKTTWRLYSDSKTMVLSLDMQL
jgi:hypothetical protein